MAGESGHGIHDGKPRIFLENFFQMKIFPFAQIDEMTVQIGGTSLETEPTGTIVGGMLYCDLLSPYRALEYVYIQSVLNGNPFQ